MTMKSISYKYILNLLRIYIYIYISPSSQMKKNSSQNYTRIQKFHTFNKYPKTDQFVWKIIFIFYTFPSPYWPLRQFGCRTGRLACAQFPSWRLSLDALYTLSPPQSAGEWEDKLSWNSASTRRAILCCFHYTNLEQVNCVKQLWMAIYTVEQ